MGPLLLASPPVGIADALLCVLSLSACCRCCWVDDIPRAEQHQPGSESQRAATRVPSYVPGATRPSDARDAHGRPPAPPARRRASPASAGRLHLNAFLSVQRFDAACSASPASCRGETCSDLLAASVHPRGGGGRAITRTCDDAQAVCSRGCAAAVAAARLEHCGATECATSWLELVRGPRL